MTASILGGNVRRLRKARRWQQWRLAQESGVSQPMIACVERGERGGSARTIGLLAAALGAEVSALMFPRTCRNCGGKPDRGFICQLCGSAGDPPAKAEAARSLGVSMSTAHKYEALRKGRLAGNQSAGGVP
jgi:transcriptional regulator with XRE-family HTH domain